MLGLIDASTPGPDGANYGWSTETSGGGWILPPGSGGSGGQLPGDPVGALAETLKESFEGFLARIRGRRPSGELRKFNRCLFPLLYATARYNNKRVYAAWYSELVEVTPNGEVSVAGVFSSVEDVDRLMKALADQYGSVALITCTAGAGDFEDLQAVKASCRPVWYSGGLLGGLLGGGGSGSSLTPPTGASLSGGLVLGLGLLAWYLFKR